MEAATAEQVQATEEATRPEAAAPNATPTKMFRYSEYIDIGPGAEECEHSRDGACDDIEHFHAWCRLPNPFQHKDIREKGLAAKARRIRGLKDPESDAYAVLEGELAEVNHPHFLDSLVDELMSREMADDYFAAQREVEEREEFEHIGQQREEFNRLALTNDGLPDEEQSDDFKQVKKIMDAYLDALRAEIDAIQAPKRASFEQRGFEELLELVRAKRIGEEADRQFLDTYNAWMWFVGTFKVQPHETLRRPYLPMWSEIGDPRRPTPGTMYSESPEVIDTLKSTFNDLTNAVQAGASGN